jgi:hypothetical protein
MRVRFQCRERLRTAQAQETALGEGVTSAMAAPLELADGARRMLAADYLKVGELGGRLGEAGRIQRFLPDMRNGAERQSSTPNTHTHDTTFNPAFVTAARRTALLRA